MPVTASRPVPRRAGRVRVSFAGQAQNLPLALPMARTTPRKLVLALALGACCAALLAALATALVVWTGAYDVAADVAHLQPVYNLLEITKVQSVRRRARPIAERALDAPLVVRRGAACFAQHCLSCHGAPGVSAGTAGLTMQPLPGPLVAAANRWRQRELVWIVRHGIRMSAMPAWRERLADDDIWAVTGFMQAMPALSPPAYAVLAAEVSGQVCALLPGRHDAAPDVSAAAGRDAIRRHACHGCHSIPGIVGSDRQVGPPLAGFGRRTLIAGRLPNTPDNLVLWLREPQTVKPHTAMPTSGIGEADARAIAAYLGGLH